ncbi:MAG: putative porin [Bacteroidales bacterium]|nr:putative porin [Bacteroidales bacterium]
MHRAFHIALFFALLLMAIPSEAREFSFAVQDTVVRHRAAATQDAPRQKKNMQASDSLISVEALPDSLTRAEALPDSLIAENMAVDSLQRLFPVDTITAHTLDSLMEAYYLQLYADAPDEKDTKDAIKQMKKDYRDSVLKNTPRILETFVIPDSLYYKRVLTWTHDPYTNEIDMQPIDTSYNWHFNDNPYLKVDLDYVGKGPTGSSAMPVNYFKRDRFEVAPFFENNLKNSFIPENTLMYNTKSPYTELFFSGNPFSSKEKEELNVKVMVTQNILPSLNLTLMFKKYGSTGALSNEKSDDRSYDVGLNYVGKKYEAHFGFIGQRVSMQENGGVNDTRWIRDTTIDLKAVEVNLSNANTTIKRTTLFLTHTLAIPINFFRHDADSLALGEGTVAYVGHSIEFSNYWKQYTDVISSEKEREFYNNQFYINASRSSDSLSVKRLENRLFIKLQPFNSDAILSKIIAGVGYQMLFNYRFEPIQYVTGPKTFNEHNGYIYGGVNGQYKQYFKWDAAAEYTFAGYDRNDLSISGNIKFSFYPFKDGIHLNGHVETTLDSPSPFEKEIYFNHHQWKNDFAKVSDTRVEASLEIPYSQTKAFFGYSLVKNKLYYDSTATIKQFTTPVSVLSVGLEQNVKLWLFHLDHRLLFQISSQQDVIPLPKFTANLRYYIQFPVVKNVMTMQIGANGIFNTKYYKPGYMPDLGVFYNQHAEECGNNPYFDIFVNAQWKRLSIFVKYTNTFYGSPNRDYFSAYRYIRADRRLKLGIFWPF